jgi:hypothetical protein
LGRCDVAAVSDRRSLSFSRPAVSVGRTPFASQPDAKGREHHARAYSSWLAGGGVKAGLVYGKTDDYGIEIASDPVHIHDFHATLLYLLGMDHTRLTFRHAGRDYRLTDVAGQVVKEIMA